mmetsp:Transcript_220/g.570  ORF Transcript_220/g.570 Transcript_220/m.570 type:complete len:143 (-) Transcript_220:260-688(-)
MSTPPHGGQDQDTFAKVMEMDAAFKAQAKEKLLDPSAEATALSEMLQGNSKTMVQEACVSHLGEVRWCELTQAHEFWKAAGISSTGSAVCKVVEELEAEHLRPTGILERIRGGNAPACNGLSTLMKYLDTKKPEVEGAEAAS